MLDKYLPLSYTSGLLFIDNYDVEKINTSVVQSNIQTLLKSMWTSKKPEQTKKSQTKPLQNQ